MLNAMFFDDLTDHEKLIVQKEFRKKKISAAVTWILWLFTGLLGGHRFFLGDIAAGLLYILLSGIAGTAYTAAAEFTLYNIPFIIFASAAGLLAIFLIVDGLTLGNKIRKVNKAIEANIMLKVIAKTRSKKTIKEAAGWQRVSGGH